MPFVGNKLMRIVRQLRTGIVKVVGIVEVPIDIPIDIIVVVDMNIAGIRNKIVVAEDIASIVVMVVVAALHGAIGLTSEGIYLHVTIFGLIKSPLHGQQGFFARL